MTNLREAAQMALDALIRLNENRSGLCNVIKEIEALRAALAQPAQKPVATVTGVYGGRFVVQPINKAMVLPSGMAFYTAPPQREWQGLTDEEIEALRHIIDWTAGWSYGNFARALEAKLKEKNA